MIDNLHICDLIQLRLLFLKYRTIQYSRWVIEPLPQNHQSAQASADDGIVHTTVSLVSAAH